MGIFRQYVRVVFGLGGGSETVAVEACEGRPQRAARIRRFKRTEGKAAQAEEALNRTRARIAIIITWILAVVLFSSLVCVIVCAAAGWQAPDLITNAFWASLGYIGGSFMSFMGTTKRAEEGDATRE